MKSLDSEGIVREDYLTLRDGRMVIPLKLNIRDISEVLSIQNLQPVRQFILNLNKLWN